MHMVDIIRKKRDGGALTDGEIDAVVRGCADGTIPDYQLSALMMAVAWLLISFSITGPLITTTGKKNRMRKKVRP